MHKTYTHYKTKTFKIKKQSYKFIQTRQKTDTIIFNRRETIYNYTRSYKTIHKPCTKTQAYTIMKESYTHNSQSYTIKQGHKQSYQKYSKTYSVHLHIIQNYKHENNIIKQ